MLTDFDSAPFIHDGIEHTLYTKGTGRGIVLMHELPGMTEACIALADRLVNAGYRVYMPHMFGKVGESNVIRNSLRVCISREFYVFASNKTSPIVKWLQAICRKAHAECGGPGVGAIGMCLTGNFAISLMADPVLLAPVSCQPSLPIAMGEDGKAAFAMSPKNLKKVKARAQAGQRFLCFRFSNDSMSPGVKYQALQKEFGPAFDGMEIPSPDESHDISPKAHSVLTADFVDKTGHPTRIAMDKVLAFFEEQLRD